MSMAIMTRDDARELARVRLSEVLAEVLSGFRPEKAFRCINPSHEDRHPSMRYQSRTNTVHCYSCGWTGDVFKVVGAVYGLAAGDAFAKAYEMLGLEVGRSARRFVRKVTPKTPNTTDRTAYLLNLIYPPGWDVVAEVKLPMPLAIVAEVECSLMGILAKYPEDAAICRECGLEEWHFDNQDLGEFYRELCGEAGMAKSCSEFIAWLEGHTAPRHMLRRLVGFVVGEGRRRKLDAALAKAYSHFQNGESPYMVMEDILNTSELVMDDSYDIPEMDDNGMRNRLDVMFGQWLADNDPRQIIAEYRRPYANSAESS